MCVCAFVGDSESVNVCVYVCASESVHESKCRHLTYSMSMTE